MDDCRRTAERLTSYVDEALPSDDRDAVERHLNSCPPCHKAAVAEQGGRTLVRERADRLRETPPPGLRSRCEAIAQAHCAGRSRSPWLTRLVPATLMAAVVTVAVLGVLSLATRGSGTLLAAQLTADHVKCFGFFESTSAADSRTLEQELDARYGWDVHVPPSSPENGVRLVGGRRCLYAEGTVPHLMYRSGALPVSLFRLEGVTRESADMTTLGYRCRIWSRAGNTYVLVTPDSTSPEHARFVAYLQQEAR